MSVAKEIGTALSVKLAEIRTVNGFNTEIGYKVFKGRRSLDDKAIPCVVLAELADNAADSTAHGKIITVAQRYTMEAHIPCDPNNPNDAAHDVIEDIKKCVFAGLSDINNTGRFFSDKVKTLKYVGKAILPRQDGTAFVGASVTVEVVFKENLTAP
jgi:hypothetical protein